MTKTIAKEFFEKVNKELEDSIETHKKIEHEVHEAQRLLMRSQQQIDKLTEMWHDAKNMQFIETLENEGHPKALEFAYKLFPKLFRKE